MPTKTIRFEKPACLAVIGCGLISLFLSISQAHAANPAFCSIPQDVTIAGASYTITDSCHIEGDLDIGLHGQLFVDYSANPSAVFEVSGDIRVGKNGVLRIKRGTFQINQNFSEHRIMQSFEFGTIAFENVAMSTNPDESGNRVMYYNAFGHSRMMVISSFLDKANSWLLGNFYHDSELIAINSIDLPTEVYMRESSTIRIAAGTSLSLWIEFGLGVGGSIDLPDQTAGGNTPSPYTWSAGRNAPGLTGVDWGLEIFNSRIGLGVISRGGSSVTVNGRGTNSPGGGELTIGYIVEAGSQTLNGLQTGIQNVELGNNPVDPTQPQLKLNDVNLGILAWQIYALQGATVEIEDSIVNEVGSFQGSQVMVTDSHLQLGAVGAFGVDSEIHLTNSEIHSQALLVQTGGHISVNDSNTYGAVIQTDEFDSGAGVMSSIAFSQGEFLPNGDPDVACNVFDLSTVLFPDGTVICNPFIPSGAQVTQTPDPTSFITCDGTLGCNW